MEALFRKGSCPESVRCFYKVVFFLGFYEKFFLI